MPKVFEMGFEANLKAEAEREDGRVKAKLGHILGRNSDEMDIGGNETTL